MPLPRYPMLLGIAGLEQLESFNDGTVRMMNLNVRPRLLRKFQKFMS